MIGSLVENSPYLVVFVISTVLFLLCSEIGFRIGNVVRGRREDTEGESTGIVTGSILGLTSFMLAFTFGIAAANHAERRGLVLEEANAIGTAYLRADFVSDEAARDALKTLLRDYTEMRASVVESDFSVPEYVALIDASEALHGQMWQLISAQARAEPSPLTALVVSAMNDVIDLHSLRVSAGTRRKIPGAIWIVLYGISALALTVAGYRFGMSFKTRPELLPGMVVAFSCVISLISDLDNPGHGFLKTDQSAMLDLLDSLDNAEKR